MISAILSLMLGVISLGALPIVLPVIGLALGLNSLIKERKKKPKKIIIVISIIGIIINGLIIIRGLILMFFYKGFID